MALQRKKSFQANDLIHDQFIVLGKLDNKKHSSIILKGFDKITHNFVVIKITSAAYREKNKNVTKILQRLRGSTGVPNIIWRGMEGPNTFTVTECLGPNLKKLFLLMDKQFSIGTISLIAIQILNTLEEIHGHDYVCCNIMPKEILISLKKKCLNLFITDYKQARKVKSSKVASADGSHAVNKAILNKFSSVNLHLGLPASKKDDLESLGYILVYFFKKGNLFDKNIKVSNRDEKIKFYEQQKLSIVPETFCSGLPQEVVQYMTYIKSMQTNQMNERIDYDYLRKLFRNLFNKHATMDGFQYDWISKAMTYNMDPNAGMKNDDKNSDKQSEILTFQSSKYHESEVFVEEKLPRDNLHLSVFASPTQANSMEYDFLDVDESPVLSTKSEPLRINKVELFDQKIKTIQYVKKRNSSCSIPQADDDLHKNRVTSESKDIERITMFSSDLSEENYRPQLKSVTEVPKMSKFAKNSLQMKGFKSR